jgi:GR25 family glycosyltransferase involved in LPS biosynthesis
MKAFVISLSKIHSSANSSAHVLSRLIEYGFDAHLFEGTYGDEGVSLYKQDNRRIAQYGIKTETISVDEYKLRFPGSEVPTEVGSINLRIDLSKDPKLQEKIIRPGVIGCFYSHYRLWKICIDLDEPIFIFEDDVMFERGYTPVVWTDILMLCTGKSAHENPKYANHLYNPPEKAEALKLPNTSMPGAVGYAITPNGAKKLVDAYKEEVLPADTAMNKFVVNLEFHSQLMGRAAIDKDGKESLTKTGMWGSFNDYSNRIG